MGDLPSMDGPQVIVSQQSVKTLVRRDVVGELSGSDVTSSPGGACPNEGVQRLFPSTSGNQSEDSAAGVIAATFSASAASSPLLQTQW